jgi:lysophospholipase L1-like esterase
MNVTSSSGSNIQLKADIWDVSGGSRLVLQMGDSRNWFGNNHGYPHGGSVACDSLGNLMQPVARFYAPVFNLGMSGAKAADIDTLIAQWLTDFGSAQGRIGTILLNVGINDCLASAVSSGFTTPYQSVVSKGIAAGAKVRCESIGDTTASTPHANLPGYNSAITSIVAGTPGAYNGTDEYTLSVNNPSWLSGDGVHDTDTGFAGVRTQRSIDYAGVV